MPTFRCQGQEWELPHINPDSLPNVRPSLFISYFFAIESNKRDPASSNNKHFLTEAFRALLEYKLGYRQGGEDMAKALQRWKDDKYWTVAHGGPNDSFSTRNNPNSHPEVPMATTGHNSYMDSNPDKQFECFFWHRNGFCKFSDDDCVYAHYPTGKVKEYIDAKDRANGLKPYKNANSVPIKQTECFFWTQGTCKFSDDECMYAHYPINRGSDHPEWRDRGRRDDSRDTFRQDNFTNAMSPKTADKQLECYYWRYTSFCKYSEDECLYAHHPTGRVKELPGLPRSTENYPHFPEPRRAIEAPKSDQKDLKTVKGPTEYAMPRPTSLKLSELTLSAFLDLFWDANPAARKERPWEAILTYYKNYITKNFGKDTLKHIIAALSRTKQPIPPELMKSYISNLEAELASKNLLGALESEVSSGAAPTISSKRPRADEEHSFTTPKRMKSERDSAAAHSEPDIVSEFLRQIPHNDRLDVQKQSHQAHPQQGARLYSPSMPHVTATGLENNHPVMNERIGSQVTSAERPASGMMNGRMPNTRHEGERPSTARRNHTSGHVSADISPVRPSSSVADLSNSLRRTASPTLLRKQTEITTDRPPRFVPAAVHTGEREGNTESHRAPSRVKDMDYTRTEQHDQNMLKHNKEDVSTITRLEPNKPTINGYHSPPALTKTPVSKLSKPKDLEALVAPPSSAAKKPQEGHKAEVDQGSEHKGSTNGDTHGRDMVSAPILTPRSMAPSRAYTYTEEVQEPITANIVRLEALLRGALFELETLKRAAR